MTTINNEGTKELVWVASGIKDKLEAATTYAAQSEIINEVIQSERKSYKAELAALDDDLVVFKGVTTKFRIMLDEVVQDQEGKMGLLVDRINDVHKSVKDRVDFINDRLQPVYTELSTLEAKLSKVQTVLYQLHTGSVTELIDLVDKLDNMDSKRFNVLCNLFETTR